MNSIRNLSRLIVMVTLLVVSTSYQAFAQSAGCPTFRGFRKVGFHDSIPLEILSAL